ncbi:hypothetical protein D3C72_2210580 [compost metagenome]
MQASHHPAQCGFAAARFAHQAQHFAGRNRQAHAVDGVHGAGFGLFARQLQGALDQVLLLDEALVHIAQFDDGGSGMAHAVGLSATRGAKQR